MSDNRAETHPFMPTLPPPVSGSLESRVLEVLDELVGELRGGQLSRSIRLLDSLERDLGISSLERVELIVRLESTFKVRLGDRVMTEAETPGDLAVAIRSADPAATEILPDVSFESAAAIPAPASARTLVEALAWHSERTPDRVHIHLREDDGREIPLTYGWLWKQSLAVATGLTARGLGHRDTVAIMLRNEPAFFSSFFGTLMAGCVPVPLYPPFRADRIEEYVERQVGILRNADTRLMITFADVERVAALLVGRAPSLGTVLTADTLAAANASPPAGATSTYLKTHDPALIQYTSGSTGSPKGVLLSHANLLANIRSIQRALDIGAEDVAVSWLPLYHDMGLIGAWLGALYCGTPLVVMSPLAFLARPIRWLRALHVHRGTLSPAPNFAYDLCVHRIDDDDLNGLDLSSVRVLLNGSEKIVPETLERFIERFTPFGLKPEALLPVYGLAECSVGLATPTAGRRPRIDRVDRTTFQETGRAGKAAESDLTAVRFVSCGRALPDHEMRVVDESGAVVAERHEGHVQFRGPSATSGYYRKPQATRELVRADGWLETGDLGYVSDGELFLTGRNKDLIIKGGRNLHPHEAEEVVGDIPGIRKGCVAAFGVLDPDTGTERFVIVAETRATSDDERAEIQPLVFESVSVALGIPPDTVVLGAPGSVLKTSSGKIRRRATRIAYLAGHLSRRRPSLLLQWVRLFAHAGMSRLSRLARRLLWVAFTAWVLVLLGLTAPLVWAALLIGPSGNWINRFVGRWTRVLFALAGCRLDVSGLERLHDLDSAVYVSNHASYLDPVVIMATLPVRVRFAAKRRLSRYPFLGTAIRKGGHITIEKAELAQQMEGADAILSSLRAGESLFIFPEGTFNETTQLMPFRLGAFRAAVETGRPVVPITIRGTRHIFPANTLLLRPGRVTVTVGEPLHPDAENWQEIVRLRNTARAVIAERVGEPG